MSCFDDLPNWGKGRPFTACVDKSGCIIYIPVGITLNDMMKDGINAIENKIVKSRKGLREFLNNQPGPEIKRV